MTITVPLQPHEEARLLAAAKAKGISADALVREAVSRLLAEAPGDGGGNKPPTRSVRGLLAKYGPAPSGGEIDENRAGMLASFARGDF
jgi:hypothetical protein